MFCGTIFFSPSFSLFSALSHPFVFFFSFDGTTVTKHVCLIMPYEAITFIYGALRKGFGVPRCVSKSAARCVEHLFPEIIPVKQLPSVRALIMNAVFSERFCVNVPETRTCDYFSINRASRALLGLRAENKNDTLVFLRTCSAVFGREISKSSTVMTGAC